MSLVRWKRGEVKTAASRGGGRPGTTLADVESLAIPLVQEVVFMADFRCSQCQQRVGEVMSKMNGETQSVVVSVLEKKVVLTCAYTSTDKLPERQIVSANRNSWRKGSLIIRLFKRKK